MVQREGLADGAREGDGGKIITGESGVRSQEPEGSACMMLTLTHE